ncbi:hypothetical protein [Pasteuria penetrans]|uniref:hypothetical protein n=1 Tax=Pasteuria penetrans TaxID=86005 RepID=UPI0011F09187|nr:hypothetical protein [Pasteuria penetrans]
MEDRALEDAESRNGPIRIGMDDVSTRKGQRYFTTIHDQDSRAGQTSDPKYPWAFFPNSGL